MSTINLENQEPCQPLSDLPMSTIIRFAHDNYYPFCQCQPLSILSMSTIIYVNHNPVS